jgi:hypothetical protein
LLLALWLQTRYLAELRALFPGSFTSGPFCGVDAGAMTYRAAGLLTGSVPGDRPYSFIPLYPAYLAIINVLAEDSLILPVYLQALLQLVGIAALYAIGRLIFSRLTGILAALGLATYNYYIFYLPCFDQSLLTVPFFTLAIFFLLLYLRTHQDKGLLAAGITLATATLSRPTILVIYPIVLIWLYYQFKIQNSKLLLKQTALLVLPFLLFVAPITWHNYQVSGQFILMTDNADVNLFTGNNPDATGLDSLAHVQSQPAVVRFQELFPRVAAGETTLTAEVLRYMREQPGDWLALTTHKTWLWLAESDERLVSPFFPLMVSQSHSLARLPLEWRGLMAAALLGLLLARGKSHRQTAFLLLVYGTFSLATILFFIQLRFRLPFAPYVLLLASALLASAPEWRARQPLKFWTVLGVMLLLYPLLPSLWIFIVIFAVVGLFLRSSHPAGAAPQRMKIGVQNYSFGLRQVYLQGSDKAMLCQPKHNFGAPKWSVVILLFIAIYLLVVGWWLKVSTLAATATQSIDHYLGPPLVGEGVLGQTFQANCDGLNQIEVVLGTFKQPHDRPVTFHLATDVSGQEILYVETFEGASVEDYQKRRFSFEPIPNSAGRTFFFFLSSPTSTPPNALTVRGYTDTPLDRYPAGSAFAGRLGDLQQFQADIAFAAFCDETWWQKMQRVKVKSIE